MSAISTRDRVLRRGNDLSVWKNETFELARPNDIRDGGPIVILIHGFTRHGLNVEGELTEYLTAEPLSATVLYFNYNSYEGVRRAAESLRNLLDGLNELSHGALSSRGIFLIGHSMGGLVARYVTCDPDGRRTEYVRGVVMLGTPNNGVPRAASTFVQGVLMKYIESLSGTIVPWTLGCPAFLELTRQDAATPLIDRLNSRWQATDGLPPILTISGGRQELEVGRNALLQALANHSLQRWINSKPNDGLVAETSVTLPEWATDSTRVWRKHYSEYPEYPQVNHTHLVHNPSLAQRITIWINQLWRET